MDVDGIDEKQFVHLQPALFTWSDVKQKENMNMKQKEKR